MIDTNMTPDWVANAIKKNPCVLLDSGNIRTCPVRLSFPHLYERSKPIPPNTVGKFSTNIIFAVAADLSLLKQQMNLTIMAKWPTAGTKTGPKLKSPFKLQSEMTKYDGYGEEGTYIIAVADREPAVIDSRMARITDTSRVYPGVWAVVTINPFTYDKGVNKGGSFGLQSVMIIADDKNLGGGGGGNLAADYAGIEIDASVSSAGVFDDSAEANSLFS